jgi:hypothetical protein
VDRRLPSGGKREKPQPGKAVSPTTVSPTFRAQATCGLALGEPNLPLYAAEATDRADSHGPDSAGVLQAGREITRGAQQDRGFEIEPAGRLGEELLAGPEQVIRLPRRDRVSETRLRRGALACTC